MRPIRCCILLALCLLTAGVRAQETPAAGLPSDTLIYVQMDQAHAQQVVKAFTIPPILGMVGPQVQHPFSMLGDVMEIAPERLAQAAPHLQNITMVLSRRHPDDPVFVLTFDDDRWPASLMSEAQEPPDNPAALTTTGGAPWWGVNGRHLFVGPQQDAVATVSRGDFEPLAGNEHFVAAARKAGEAPIWGWANVQEILTMIREDIGPDDQEFEMFVILSGLNDATDLLATVALADDGLVLHASLGLQEDAVGVAALLPEAPATARTLVPAASAAWLAVDWGDPEKFMTGLIEATRRGAARVAPDADFDREVRGEIEEGLQVSLDALARQVGSGAAFHLLARGPHYMVGRADWTSTLAVREPDAFSRTLQRWLDNGVPPAVQQVAGMDVRQWPAAPAFYAVQKPAFVVAGSPRAVASQFTWLRRSERPTPRAPQGAVSLHLKAKDLLVGWADREGTDRRLMDGPSADVERLDEEQVLVAWILGLAGALAPDAELTASLAREGRTVTLDARLNGLPEQSHLGAPVLLLPALIGFQIAGVAEPPAAAEDVMMQQPGAPRPGTRHVLPD
jgi:hypothetical protein